MSHIESKHRKAHRWLNAYKVPFHSFHPIIPPFNCSIDIETVFEREDNQEKLNNDDEVGVGESEASFMSIAGSIIN
jgi:hypothetical protein